MSVGTRLIRCFRAVLNRSGFTGGNFGWVSAIDGVGEIPP